MGLAEIAMWLVVESASRAAPWAEGSNWWAISKWWNTSQCKQWNEHLRRIAYGGP